MTEQMRETGRADDLAARREALAAVEALRARPTRLVEFVSRGRVAVIGGLVAKEFAPRLNGALQPHVLLTEDSDEPGVPFVVQGGRPIRIDGHMGAFRIQLGEHGKANYEVLEADLILDLSPAPLLGMPLRPLGYLAAGVDEADLDAAVEHLNELTGTFEKPRFFDYDASICAHGRSGYQACNRCIEACPAEAIESIGEAIAVDPYLCQGGGICAAVCPSGAIRYSYPSATDTLERIRTLLRVYRERGGSRPVLAFVSEADEAQGVIFAGNELPVVVEELASIGLEVWLSSLAYGATSVLLVNGGSVPAGVAVELTRQLAIAGEILAALGYPGDAVSMVDAGDLAGGEHRSAMPEMAPAGFSGIGGKRQTAFMAVDHLFQQAQQPRPMVSLPAGAPFGTAQVDDSACTLCLACVGACPGKALQQGRGEPSLSFIEANCLQCGLCTRTCPENAIWITPRLVFDRDKRSGVRLLYREPPFCCVSCGKPFATRSVIDSMLAKLEGHWMFESERARRRLKMCQDCRTVDALQDPTAMDTDKTTRE